MIFTLVLQIFALEKIKSAMHVVFIVFYIIAVLVLAALFGEGYAPYVLIPSLLAQYFIGVGINDMFIYHDKFLYDCESHEGKELETYLFHNNLNAIDLTEKTKGQQAVLFGLSVVMFVVLVFGKLSEGTFNIFIDLLVIAFYLSIMLCYFTLGLFKNDVFYAFLGFKDYIADKKRLLRTINWFMSEYSEELNDAKSVQKQDFNFMPLPEMNLEQDFGSDARPNIIIELIFQFIKYAAIFALGAGLLYFFLKPFFTKHFRIFWTEGKLITFFRDFWEDIKNFFRIIFSKDNSPQAYATVQSKSFQDSMMDFLKKAKRSKEKTAEIDRLTKQFMKLIDWGETNKIHYKANLAPAEYTVLIAQNLQTDENKEAARNAGLLFEKALYDKEVLSGEEEKLFEESIKQVLQCG